MEKAKVVMTTPVVVDRSSLNRTSDDKLVKVQSAIEVFTTEIQMIMASLSDSSESLSDGDVGILFTLLSSSRVAPRLLFTASLFLLFIFFYIFIS